jgi:hypothetical protein
MIPKNYNLDKFKTNFKNFQINTNNNIKLKIKVLGEMQNIEILKNSNIRTIKYKILSMYGIMIHKQKLIFNDIELYDNDMITDYSIKDMDLIYCNIFE